MHKLIIPILAGSICISACKNPATGKKVERRMPHVEVTKCLAEYLPDSQVSVVTDSNTEDRFRLTLSEEDFERLSHAFLNELSSRADKDYGYDRSSKRSTTFTEGDSTFSCSIGKGDEIHYVITGVYTPANQNKAIIWVKPSFAK